MQSMHSLAALPDGDLLRGLVALLSGSRHTEAELVAHLGEVDARRLYLHQATPSMFAYCTERLHLSEGEACLRIAAARAAREHPILLEMLADGRLHLGGIAKLAPHLRPDNREAVLGRAVHKSNRQIEELVAELAPRPDVRSTIRRLPAGRVAARSAPTRRIDLSSLSTEPAASPNAQLPWSASEQIAPPSGSATDPSGQTPHPSQKAPLPEWVNSNDSAGTGVTRRGLDASVSGQGLEASVSGQGLDAGAQPPVEPRAQAPVAWLTAPPPRPARIEPLAPSRYKVEFTASKQLRDKLERLKALMRSSVPNGDLAAVIDAAVTEKLERMEARRFGRTGAPRKTVATSDTSGRTRAVPAAVRRVVHERDGERCVFVDANGNRCTARAGLEFHHRKPFAMGGDHSPGGVALLCGPHNRLLGRVDFGGDAARGPRRTKGAASTPSCPRPSLPASGALDRCTKS